MRAFISHLPFAALCLALAGCASDYSPNTYAGNAVQLANKVEAGTIVGFRQVAISANGNVGAVTGGAAGGLLGSEYGRTPFAAVGGGTVGAMLGTALDHAAGDTTGWEYIVRKANSEMLSVTQREKTPLELGRRVLVIIGPQARVVPDYSVPPEPPAPVVKAEAKPEPRAESNAKVEVVLSLPPGMAAVGPNGQVVSGQVINLPTGAESSVQAGGIQATNVPTAEGRTVVVHVPVTPATAGGLVPVSAADIAPATGTVSSEIEAPPQDEAAAPVDTPADAPASQN